jgi:hypothetical protein
MANALAPAIAAVIGNHLETDRPVLVEGDYLLPELVVRAVFDGQPADGRVRAVFLHEPDAGQLVANYLQREPGAGEQRLRAQVGADYSTWLAQRCDHLGVPVVATRPWASAIERVQDALTR